MMPDITPKRIYGLGWRPDLPDHRDKPLTMKLAASAPVEVPIRTSLRDKCSPVRHQGDLGSCTGFATTAAVEYLRRVDEDAHSTIYSPLYTYYRARELDGCERVDVGAYLRDAVKSVNKWGVPPESRWIYLARRFASTPNVTADREAGRWKLGGYYRCDSLSGVMAALASGFPVVAGFSCFESMFTPEVDRTGIIPEPTAKDTMVGGHAICLTGYDRETRLVQFKNSWGADWGDGGYGYLPFNYFTHDLVDDMWALTSEA